MDVLSGQAENRRNVCNLPACIQRPAGLSIVLNQQPINSAAN